jgi:iron complex outermembrane receptor protein
VPVVTVNTNAIPTTGVSRVEVLLDGASAIYGADAVAGVVNTVLKTDFEGLTAELNFGSEEAGPFDGTVRLAGVWRQSSMTTAPMCRYSPPILGAIRSYASERPFSANADLRSQLPASVAE